MTAHPVKFKAIPQERIWGGDRLKSWFGVTDSIPIGEYWVLSGHPNGTSVVVDGPLAGKTLVEITREFPEEYLGRSTQGRFPLLIKFLEAKTDLSVQIHPDDAYALAHEGDFGKTEAWYVLDCGEAGRVNYGHAFESREDFLQAVADGRVREGLRYRDIAPGDIVFVPSRTLHALLSDTVVIEIQQTSDVTYRVYDWDRVDASGKPRELHVEKAAEVMTYGPEADTSRSVPDRVVFAREGAKVTQRVKCAYFTMDEVVVPSGDLTLAPGRVGNPDILIVAEGGGTLGCDGGEVSLQRGDTLLIPASQSSYTLQAAENLRVLRAFY